ncbi:MAG: hypothetical protein NZ772_16550, partial [Cyanobacteria bacterium]|nr:hypothetical protein [Cyanobacteriota bacterium]MDW8202945.1 secretin N-terminal domain-containing protein [Cyanobacteriota bacterium SKYGB_h_bin112]
LPIDGNSVRVIVTGEGSSAPRGVTSSSPNGLIFKIQAAVQPIAVQVPAPAQQPVAAVQPNATFTTLPPVPGQSSTVNPTLQPPRIETTPIAQAQPGVTTIAQAQPGTTATPTRQGDPATISPNPTPPTLPRAVPPPLGDVTLSNLDPSPTLVQLGSRERIPRLVLREAPAREVLSLLARVSGTNIAYIDSVAGAPGQAGAAPPQPGQAGGADTSGPRVTLDIENESVQDVFNHVLRITGLQANRIGSTIYVGANLPVGARNLISRSIRLNQVTATDAAAYLANFGAETTITIPSQPEIVTQTIQGVAGAPPITQQVTRQSAPSIQTLTNRTTNPIISLVLQGLFVTPDQRLNAITLVGTPYQVELATNYLKQLDLRRRQVAVNVKIIDVNLSSAPFSNASFSFGVGDNFVSVSDGVIGVNFGRTAPNALTPPPTLTTGSASNPVSGFFPGNILTPSGLTGFLARLTQALTTNNAKILTDPTLIIQEGQTSSVNLTEKIVTDTTQTISQTDTSTQITTTNTLEEVGLQLTITVERIDDNGFVTLNVSPRVSSPAGGTQTTATGTFPIIGTRELSSGSIRIRDNQTLVLAGIIREEDRQNIRKVPILGDLPIIGALFRGVDSETSRNEIIVVLTASVMDDTHPNSNVNYGYTPSRESQEILQRNGYR